jgi:excinuclease ABC subunit C
MRIDCSAKTAKFKAMNTPESKQTRLDRGVKAIKSFHAHVGTHPGVYRMLNEKGKILYIGKARNIKARISAYTRPDQLPIRLQRMIAETVQMEFTTTHTESEALLLEAILIKQHLPRYNILLRDDKSFPYIHITGDHEFPRLEKYRGPRDNNGKYFGPYTNGGGTVDQTLAALERIFLLRNCSDSFFAARNRPCLQYFIKRCSAPCVEYIAEEEYGKLVHQAVQFLSGKNNEIIEFFAENMRQASARQDYEAAANFRDRLQALSTVQARQKVSVTGLGDADLIGVAQKNGQTCIQVFFYRHDAHLGNYAFFPAHEEDDSVQDILSAFIPQLYENKELPNSIIVSHPMAHTALLSKALTEKAGHKVTIQTPQRGRMKDLIEHVSQNASQALAQKLIRSASQQELMVQMANHFGLSSPPTRIEVYDNSHIQGRNAVGAMIVANEEGFNKKAYRKFNIRLDELGENSSMAPDNMTGGDDYAMLYQVLTRRFKRAQEEDPGRESGQWPSVVLIDGGLGQLNIAIRTLAELGINDLPLIAIAKGPDRNAGNERFFMPGRDPIELPAKDPVLYFMQRLRDEAHRFAIGFHRKKRQMELGRSELDEIHGIGASRKRALLHHFGSVRGIKQAGLKDLEMVKGVSKSLAKKIYNHFHSGT